MRTIANGIGLAGCAVVTVVLVIVLSIGGIWLNGELNRLRNDANARANQGSQQYVTAKLELLWGLRKDYDDAGCEQNRRQGRCIAIVQRMKQEISLLPEHQVPEELHVFVRTH